MTPWKDDKRFAVMAHKFRDATRKRAAYLDAVADKGGQDWESLAVGFAIAHGKTAKYAVDFATYMTYGNGGQIP
jgi:hypothetical protein